MPLACASQFHNCPKEQLFESTANPESIPSRFYKLAFIEKFFEWRMSLAKEKNKEFALRGDV